MMLLLQTQTAALAAPPADILKLLNDSYNPSMKVEASDGGTSLHGCSLTDLKLVVEDPIDRKAGGIQARVYHSDNTSARNIILLPPTGGENLLDKGYANHLCSTGFNVVILQSWAHDTETTIEMGMHDRNAVRSLAAVRHVLDYLKPAAGDPVGIFGTSVGALTSSLAMNFDSRLKAAVLIVGGVSMPEIIATSTEQTVSRLREARMQQFGFRTPEEYLAALRKEVRIDISDFMGFTGGKKVLAVVGTEDVTVPTHLQKQMVREFGAESVEHKGNHTDTIMWAFWNKRAAFAEFFKRSLN